MTDHPDRFFWTDLETTGLDPAQDQILEVAAIVTEADLTPVATFHAVVSHNPQMLRMGSLVWKMHTDNGLLEEVAKDRSTVAKVTKTKSQDWTVNGLSFDVRDVLWEFVQQYARNAPMAGSSVGFDRGFYKQHYPQVENLLHYRNFDVSVYREAMKRWAPKVELPAKSTKHRAMEDIQASIAQAQQWKDFLTDD